MQNHMQEFFKDRPCGSHAAKDLAGRTRAHQHVHFKARRGVKALEHNRDQLLLRALVQLLPSASLTS